jgi:anion-transporting  ArsA/GET3 family ATPase
MKITIYSGTGGVGKTSIAAATALAGAHAGRKTLVMTIDPARRLRTALRLAEGNEEQRVRLDGDVRGELWATMLDVRTTLDTAVKMYGAAKLQPRILQHRIYATIADSLAGMQELMAVERIDQLIKRGFDDIIVDTAPSRHALEFLDKPAAFASFSESGWVRLIGRTYKLVEATGMMSLSRAAMDVYGRVASILGTEMVREVLDFYSIFVSIAEGYSERARKTLRLLRNPEITEFRVVSTPPKAIRDAGYYLTEMDRRGFRPGAFIVNRVWPQEPGAQSPGGFAGDVLDWYRDVCASQQEAVRQLRHDFGHRVREIIALPEMDHDIDGVEALRELARTVAR